MIGRPRVHHRSTDSTNERARVLAAAGAPHGTLVTADEQSAGRGRQGRAWVAPRRSAVLMSVVLRELSETLPLAAAVAVCESLPVEAQIKWPNDVWIEERKVAGVLIEARPPEWAVIGVGINVTIAEDEFPPDVRWPATSVGHEVEIDAMRLALCAALDRWATAPTASTVHEYRDRNALEGREIGWDGAGVDSGAGRAIDIDERGNLLVDTAAGERLALGSGEVSLRLD